MEAVAGKKTGRIYCRKIDSYKKQSIYPIIQETVNKTSKVVTDEFPTYDKLKELFPKAKQKILPMAVHLSPFINRLWI